MPYIKPEKRAKWEEIINEIVSKLNELSEKDVEGEINYLVSSILKKTYTPKYFNYNRAIGLLECIKQEYYRKMVASYEDEKIKENGDI